MCFAKIGNGTVLFMKGSGLIDMCVYDFGRVSRAKIYFLHINRIICTFLPEIKPN